VVLKIKHTLEVIQNLKEGNCAKNIAMAYSLKKITIRDIQKYLK
jgi:hypothetical protein